jgi:glycosyltransferase involved in cell wall biosynthesis
MQARAKVVQIGNYPPPMCGWAIQTKLVSEELRRRGHICEILKINENRQVKDPSYVDVQGGFDYLQKVVRYALRGYQLNVHMNGMSKKGYLLALIAGLAGRLVGQPALVTFHGGLAQDYFPRHDSWRAYRAFQLLFHLAGAIACDSAEIGQAIQGYGLPREKVTAIATFSAQYLNFAQAPLGVEAEDFLLERDPVFFSYVSFRPEYRLQAMRECIALYRQRYPRAGFIWLGFPGKELPAAQEFVQGWEAQERNALLLLGNLTHDQFLTLMTRCAAVLRTPACDGVAASVLEALALGIPVVASENGRRPAGVITYADHDAADMCAKLVYVTQNYSAVKASLPEAVGEDTVAQMADWLAGLQTVTLENKVVHAG